MTLLRIDNTNFDNGLTNRGVGDLFQSLAMLDPTRFHTQMEDFNYYVAANYTITGAGAGSQALADVDGGVLRLTTAGADNDAEFLVENGQGFLIETSRPTYYRARLSIDDATDSDLFTGLADAAPLTPANGIFFRKDDDNTELDIVVRSGAGEIAADTNIFTMTTALTTMEWYWDGIDRVYYGVNGTPLGFLDLAGLALPLLELAPVIGVQAGAVAALVGDWDYYFAAKQRD